MFGFNFRYTHPLKARLKRQGSGETDTFDYVARKRAYSTRVLEAAPKIFVVTARKIEYLQRKSPPAGKLM
jgi:hypothetical protein